MNVLFISLMGYTSIYERDIYTDLLRVFISQGHSVYVISPAERRQRVKTGLVEEKGSIILRVKTGNIQKTSIIEKGISTILLESQIVAAIKKFFGKIRFNLILYTTPPITITKAVEFVKKRDHAVSYLMLKDIFPQNAADIGLLSKTGIKGILFQYFRNKEKKLYSLSDYIGCMSPANEEYVLKNNPEICKDRLRVCPNSIEVNDISLTENEKKQMRNKYCIPQDRIVYIYGGNLGKPQGINHMISCIKNQKNNEKVFFVIIGSGTEFDKIDAWVKEEAPENVRLMGKMPKNEYMELVSCCDIGLLFLDHRFTIPNFPSRIVDYMQSKLPIIACTDCVSDVGLIITKERFGWWCESNNVEAFGTVIEESMKANTKEMGERAFAFLEKEWNVKKQYIDIAKTIGWSR